MQALVYVSVVVLVVWLSCVFLHSVVSRQSLVSVNNGLSISFFVSALITLVGYATAETCQAQRFELIVGSTMVLFWLITNFVTEVGRPSINPRWLVFVGISASSLVAMFCVLSIGAC